MGWSGLKFLIQWENMKTLFEKQWKACYHNFDGKGNVKELEVILELELMQYVVLSGLHLKKSNF